MIEARGLTKTYGDTVAVNDLTFTVAPGVVTGFLGPNGAGKSTTMRLILGLDRPTSGTVTVNGSPYAQHRRPLTEVGALLEAKAIHGGRSAYNHLLAVARSNHIERKRVDEVLELVGLSAVAKRRAGKFSLGMGQRLGIATALLGDPKVLILDEPVNGLDPEGILWVRNLLKYMASQGKTIFVSSHLMSEMSQTADHLIVIGRGRLIADASTSEVIRLGSGSHVRVRSPQSERLAQLVTAEQGEASTNADGSLSVTRISQERVGEIAAAHGIVLHELTLATASLEEAFMELTDEAVDFRAEASRGHQGDAA
jgi:ABC-2 type transport system ATP-binding protein